MESETDLAYSGLHQLLTPLIDKHLDRLPVPQRDALATALGVAPGSPPDPFLVGLATLSLLADAADQQPLVCLIDDGQWLDQASIQVLSFVARRLLAEPIALVCATRTGQEVEILAGLPELPVHGLSDPDARTLLLNNVHGPVDCRGRRPDRHREPRQPARASGTAADLAGQRPRRRVRPARHPTTAHKIERSYVRRLTVLPAETQLLALAAAAEPLGDPVLLSRAAGLLGTDLTVAHPAVDAGCSRWVTGSASPTRSPARPPTTRPAPNTATRCTTPWPQPPTPRPTQTGEPGTWRARRSGPTRTSPQSSSARPVGPRHAGASPPPPRS